MSASVRKSEKAPRATAAQTSARADGGAPGAGVEKITRLMRTPAQIMVPRLLFIVAIVLLAAIGIVMVYSASSILAYSSDASDPASYARSQALFLAVGAVACIVMARVPYRIWARPPVFTTLWAVTTLLLLAVQLGLGVQALGAERSISVAGFTLQPAEFAKITVILAACSLLAMLRDGRLALRRFSILLAIAVVVPVIAIFRQPDLGTVVILVVGLFAAAILAGTDWRIIGAFIAVLVCYFAFVCVVQPYHLDRIKTLLDPWSDPSGAGYQTIQSLYARALGGGNGAGLGLSQEKYLYLPYAHTDFIFAVIGEEFGLVGTASVVALFALLAYAGMRICRNAPDLFGCMLAGSITVMIVFQACVNIGSVIGLVPVTGKALPFLSYGGSSLLATCIMSGLVLSVSFNSQVDAQSKKRRAALFVVGKGGDGAARDAGGATRRRPDRRGGRQRPGWALPAFLSGVKGTRPGEGRGSRRFRGAGAADASPPDAGRRSRREADAGARQQVPASKTRSGTSGSRDNVIDFSERRRRGRTNPPPAARPSASSKSASPSRGRSNASSHGASQRRADSGSSRSKGKPPAHASRPHEPASSRKPGGSGRGGDRRGR